MDQILCISLWIIVLGLQSVIEAEFCFRKIHGSEDSEPGATSCRGLIDKEIFPSSRACCESENGKAYARELITVGKRYKKWRCIPCWTDFVKTIPVVNGSGWSEWGEWSACSVSCTVGTKRRQRLCQGLEPSSCEGDSSIVTPCWEIPTCPVDGNWGPWNSWSECTKTCSNGTMQRRRRCNDPPPEHNGKECEGESIDTEPCNTHGCPVDGVWSEWSTDGLCDVTCGKGKITRRRLCNNPEPKHGGQFCIGKDYEIERCEAELKCPIDGQWSLWTRFTSCSITCGEGLRERTRECVAPTPRHGGKDCEGNSTDVHICYSHYPCPVNGQWTSWSGWGMCLARPCSNETGIQTRTRTCSNPQPRFRGDPCFGATTQTQPCYHNHHCPVHGNWCEWLPYSECRQANNNVNFIMRVRECNCPEPKHGGNTCLGDDYQVSSCPLNEKGTDNPRRTRCGSLEGYLEGSGYLEDDEDC